MNGHRTYSGIDTPRYAIKPIDRQGYEYKARLTGPIIPIHPGLLARIMGWV
jgi:hypothetical protein